MGIRRAAAIAALIHSIWSGPAAADDVTLTSRDGSVEISGTLLGYDGEFYRVDTVYGVLTVDGSGVRCDGPGCPDLEAFVAEFVISGALTMGEILVPALVEAFAGRNGYAIERIAVDDREFGYNLTETESGQLAARIEFRLGSSAEGFADLLAGEADIVMSLRRPRADELLRVREAGLGDLTHPRRERVVALDALVPVVAPGNPIRSVSPQALARIFAGEIDNWKTLGGADAPIAPHLRDRGSALAQLFDDRIMRPRGKTLAKSVVRHVSNRSLADAVAADPFGIGMATHSEVGNAEPLPLIGPCGMFSVARFLTIKTEDYPLTAPLFLYTPAVRLPVIAREFLDFTRSAAAQPVIERAGFVNIRIDQIPLALQGERLANAIASAGGEVPLIELQRMVDRMRGARRLTVSYRFENGRTTLDAQSQSNVNLLARQLEAGAFDGQRLIFVGFSDGEGAAETNLRLARRRAESVRQAVVDEAVTADRSRYRLTIDAFGEAMPMACDETDWGRQVNRRVEVWQR